jgi:hypothetical protein
MSGGLKESATSPASWRLRHDGLQLVGLSALPVMVLAQ